MQIETVHIDACPSWREVGVRTQSAVDAARIDAESIVFRLVVNETQARSRFITERVRREEHAQS